MSSSQRSNRIAYLSDLDIQWIMPKCTECKQKFDVFDKTPYILPCCHTVCWECLTKLNKKKHRKCPICCAFYRNYQINLAYLNLITRLNVFQNSHSYASCNECFLLAPIQKMRRCVTCESYIRARYDFPRVSCVVCLECAVDIHSGHHLSKESGILSHFPSIEKTLSMPPKKLRCFPRMVFGKNSASGEKISDEETSDETEVEESQIDDKNTAARISFRLKKLFTMKKGKVDEIRKKNQTKSKSKSTPASPQGFVSKQRVLKVDDSSRKRPSLPTEQMFSTRRPLTGWKIKHLRSSSTDETLTDSKESQISNEVFMPNQKFNHGKARLLPILSERNNFLGNYEMPIFPPMKSNSTSNVPESGSKSVDLHSYENFISSLENLEIEEKYESASQINYTKVLTGNHDFM